MPMSIMEVLTLLLVVFAALSYIINHKKNSIPPSKVDAIFIYRILLRAIGNSNSDHLSEQIIQQATREIKRSVFLIL